MIDIQNETTAIAVESLLLVAVILGFVFYVLIFGATSGTEYNGFVFPADPSITYLNFFTALFY
ncbi:MAG: hypothetical protein PHF87_00215 [Desulfotomaculaceae bacterium]|nr:hypothetical protein [Desulfotomaculaceae bacterium]